MLSMNPTKFFRKKMPKSKINENHHKKLHVKKLYTFLEHFQSQFTRLRGVVEC